MLEHDWHNFCGALSALAVPAIKAFNESEVAARAGAARTSLWNAAGKVRGTFSGGMPTAVMVLIHQRGSSFRHYWRLERQYKRHPMIVLFGLLGFVQEYR